METALEKVSRTNFTCIGKFKLDDTVNVTCKDKGEMTVHPVDCLDEEPNKRVRKFLLRTVAFGDILNRRAPAYRSAERKKKPGVTALYDLTEYEDFMHEIAESADNLFNMTKRKKFSLYRYFCQATETILDAEKKSKTGETKKRGVYPEQYQILLVASDMLKSIFGEGCLLTILESNIKDKKEYVEDYGSNENAIKFAPYLEGRYGDLSLGYQILPSKFRKVVHNQLVGVAFFFAYAIYDDMTYNLALVMLRTPLIDPKLPEGLEEVLEEDKEKIVPLAAEQERRGKKSYLFDFHKLDCGTLFHTNMIQVANRLSTFLSHDKLPITSWGPTKIVTDKNRVKHLFFRTLCADLVEIYVTHGCYPVCSSSCETNHPWLAVLQKQFKTSKKPVPLIVEYIILAISHEEICVAASHKYNSVRHQLEEFVAVKLPQGQTRPETKDLRYLYQLKGKTNWLTLPEVVNIILLGRRDPWHWQRDTKIEWKTGGSSKMVLRPKQKKIELWKDAVKKRRKGMRRRWKTMKKRAMKKLKTQL